MAVKCILTGQEKVNLSGDTMTGDLKVGSSSIGTNGYIEGTWLKTTKATESAGDFATINGEGWIYKRKPADVLGDIGGQAKITANGFLKGDGTGVITADKPIFQVIITQNTSDNSYSADKTYSKIIEAYNNGYTVQAIYNVDSANKEIYSLMSTYRSGSVKMLYFVYLNNQEEKRFTCRVTAAAEKWLYRESSLVPSNLTINNKPLSSNITLTPSDINAQPKITADGILKGDGTGNITAADETEVELVDLPQEIFWATYGTTTATELNEAWSAGKLIKLKHGNIIYDLCLRISTRFVFYCLLTTINNGNLRRVILNIADGTWEEYICGYVCDLIASVSLPAASWTDSDPYTQTVTIGGSNANTKVDIQPSEELYDQLVADNVGYLAIKNVDGTLTAVAKGGKPSVDLTVQVTYNNVY